LRTSPRSIEGLWATATAAKYCALPLHQAERGLGALVHAVGREWIEPREVEGLVVERVRELVREGEPLGEVQAARPEVDQVAGLGVVVADDLPRW
jgi:hypothetical protein